MGRLNGNLNGIAADADKIRFLHTPKDFYKLLLVNSLDKATSENSDLRVKLLFDYLRGTRGGENSCASLLKKVAGRINAYFFHTPNLHGYVKKLLPERVNEVVGLQHMKFFVFDDSIILSGANLSDTYFTDRQDRYVLIESVPELVDFFVAIFNAVTSCSFHLKTDGSLKLNDSCLHHPFEGDSEQFKNLFLAKTTEALTQLRHDSTPSDTFIYPFFQMGTFGINQEQDLMRNLFSLPEKDLEVTLASGYLNMFDEYSDLMLNEAKFPINVILASPEANGFHNAAGVSGYIPALYVYISEIFYRKINELGRSITLNEFSRPGWSFHAKGLWIDSSTSNWSATVIGSSNFGYRSTVRDLESQLLIVTSNDMLRNRMKEERSRLLEHVQPLDDAILARHDHFVPVWVRYFTKVFRNFF